MSLCNIDMTIKTLEKPVNNDESKDKGKIND
jgi:hypothetical protein